MPIGPWYWYTDIGGNAWFVFDGPDGLLVILDAPYKMYGIVEVPVV